VSPALNLREIYTRVIRERRQMESSSRKIAVYRRALLEALPESDQYEDFLMRLIDPAVSDADIGAAARAMVKKYIEEVASYRGEEL
jgi:hypothetical protein